MRIKSYRNVTYDTVIKIIEDLKSKGIELDSLSIRVSEYLHKFTKCDKGEELVKALIEKGLNEITSVMIANIVPKNIDELRSLLNFETQTFNEEKLNEILALVNSFCG